MCLSTACSKTCNCPFVLDTNTSRTTWIIFARFSSFANMFVSGNPSKYLLCHARTAFLPAQNTCQLHTSFVCASHLHTHSHTLTLSFFRCFAMLSIGT
eukprot:m.352189 g.352189  ORF g.352189 m.352189 type:complete len:98 (+) comp16462_c0_seq1:776-1069(+)